MKDKLFQVFFCIYIFWNTCLSTFLGLRGLELDGIIMRIVLVSIAGISWIFYFSSSPKYFNEKKMILLLVLFGLLFYSTQFIHRYCINYSGYIGQLLRWGADCVSGCILGMILTKNRDYSVIHKFLPLECLVLTPFMAYATITLGSTQGQMHIDGGMNYQTVAYAMAVFFGISFFYTFLYEGKEQSKLKKIVVMCAMLTQAACCAMAGGRGGLVLLVVYIGYFCSYMVKNKIVSKQKLVLLGFVFVCGFLFVANILGVFESSGFQRSSNSLDDDDRFEVWASYWKYVGDYPLLGYGLGGDYFTVGFYSHNIIVDLLLETGVIGATIIGYAYFKTYGKVYKLAKYNPMFIVVMILFIYGMVMNMFSGYWISKNVNWLAFGIAMTSSNYFRYHEKSD